jgi:hypothetical protein
MGVTLLYSTHLTHWSYLIFNMGYLKCLTVMLLRFVTLISTYTWHPCWREKKVTCSLIIIRKVPGLHKRQAR